jgi:hypothetical protein
VPKKTTPPLTNEERAKRIRETAREIEAAENSKEFERTLKKIVPVKRPAPKDVAKDEP